MVYNVITKSGKDLFLAVPSLLGNIRQLEVKTENSIAIEINARLNNTSDQLRSLLYFCIFHTHTHTQKTFQVYKVEDDQDLL